MRALRNALGAYVALFLGASTHGQVIISEFMADNKKTLADQGGAFSDWIEIYNSSAARINLAGWALTDEASRQTKWVFPSTNLAAKGYLVIFASGTNRTVLGEPLHANLKLSANGEYLALLKPDGSVASEFNPAFPQQYADVSYGIAQNVVTNILVGANAPVKMFVPNSGSLGLAWTEAAFNDSSWMSGSPGVGYETALPGFAVRNFKANISVGSLTAAQGVIGNISQQSAVYTENASVINYVNTGGGANYGNDRTFPGFTIGSDMEDFVIEATATVTIPAAGNWTFGVNSDDGFSLTIGSFTMVYADPRGPGDTLQTFNFPAAGDYPLRLVFYERGGGSELELYAAQGSFGSWNSANFRLVGETASGGLAVRAPVVGGGSGSSSYRPFIQSDVQAQMSGVNASIYLRLPFTVANVAAMQSLTLRMMYDDGFVAYLNGQEVARRNAPAVPQWNSTATGAHPNSQALLFEDINISDALGALQAGNNILAVRGLNQSAADSDFLIVPQLVEYRVSNSTTNYFATATPAAPNGGGFVAFVADTKFSVDHGFFTNAFTLAITTATPGATIKYTTNGSTPTTSNGSTYSGPITINKTTVLRAAAFAPGFEPSNVDTKTYLFLSDVIRQSPNGEAPAGWPSSWGGNTVDYGMDPAVVNSPLYSGTMINDLRTIPSFSIVTDLPNLFDAVTGIYANPGGDGVAWERPASVELIYPDGSDQGFHARAGLRVRGGYSRSTDNPKHAFRLFFREEYGDSKLKFRMFARQNGAEEFDGFDLRTFQNYSWSFGGDARGIFLRDQFSRDTQIDMGQPGERGDFYHLYVDGQYWGLYNTDERPEASFAASYFGGKPEAYDVIKVDPGRGYNIYATDGTLDAWTRLWQAAVNGFASDAAYQRVQGNNADGTRNPAYEVLLDVDNLIDYMLVIFYGGNLDAPISNFLGNTSPNNWFGFRHTNGLSGFRFVAHDSEHTLLDVNQNRVGPFAAGDPATGGGLLKSNPQYVFQQLWQNTEFKLRLADRIQKHFFNDGALSPPAALARFMKRKSEIDRAVVGESARWGDSKREPPLTRNSEWLAEINRVANNYIPQRTGIVLNQLKACGLFPNVGTPTFNQFGGNVPSGFALTITATAGTIYYTRDGADPRARGGTVAATALTYGGPVALTQSARIKARALSGGVWSALLEATFYVTQDYTDVLMTEVMYHPPDTATRDGDAFEFIELKNVGTSSRELSGVHFDHGIDYTFPVGSFVAPGQFVILVSDPVAFASKYPGVRIDGVYDHQLGNGSETISLLHVTGTPIFSMKYDSHAPWPVAADGAGFSLVPVNPNLNPDPNSAANWRASATVGGSPAADDPVPNVLPIYVNETLTHTDLPQLDAVELFNPNPTAVSIANWFLTDTRSDPFKFRIPGSDSRAVIPAGGYVVFTEGDWNADPNSTNTFRLNSHGEEIYLYSSDAQGSLTGYSDGFAYGSAENGVSFGRHVNSVGARQYPAQISVTLGGPNTGPRLGPVVVNEIQYHPLAGENEYVELKNITGTAVKLYDPAFPTNTWRLNGLGFSFPINSEIPANGLVLLTSGDPAAFRTRYAVPPAVVIFGPVAGTLQDNGETLSLQRPGPPDLNTNTGNYFIPYLDVDVVDYSPQAPWPAAANGTGASLERLNAAAYGNDPINWRASPGAPSPGVDNIGNRPPVVSAGADRALTVTNVPVTIPLLGAASDDGFPNPPGSLGVTWSQINGPGSITFANPSQPSTTATFPVLGTYTLRLRATDGALESAATVTITLTQATAPVTFVPKGSVWRYLDDGSNQGAAWRSPGFNDSAWKLGAAELGYGDSSEGRPEATSIGFGPDSNNKYVTTYFRRSFAVTSAAAVKDLVVHLMRDDGAVVYLNGTEVFRDNMPADTVDYLTLAISAVGADDEAAFFSQSASPATLVEGLNVVAVEIHQANRTSTDLSFDLELTGEGVPGDPPPVNQAPSASAGANQTVTLPGKAQLSGTVTDDGLPNPPGQVASTWSKVSGPGAVNFTNPNSTNTLASFSAAGSYMLRLTASDGALQTFSDVTIGVLENIAPVVNAGAGQVVVLPGNVTLQGSVTDDGLPNPPGQVAVSWSMVSGPGTVAFTSPGSPATSAVFSAPGTYVLRLAATDGALQSTADVTIRVVQNEAPVVNAGAGQVVVLPGNATLQGSVTDDGLPTPPGQVTASWSMVSGSGTVTFSSPSSATTTAAFSLAGSYILRLSANDGNLESTSDVTITVFDSAQPPKIEALTLVTGPTPAFRLTFTAAAGASYTIQFRDSLTDGTWTKLSDIPAGTSAQTVSISDTAINQAPRRYYRVVSPQQ
ncbi:MAG: lamin tail domain-containing protein [Verrucomicrobiota bacterium]